MLARIIKFFIGSRNQRLVRRMRKVVDKITAYEADYEALSDEQLQAKTQEFRQRLVDGTDLNDLIPEAFATVREAGKRVLGMRHFDVQLIGAMVLNQGQISEMRTGEGKTLVATAAAYLNALPGRGVHVVTVNDYLARRDAEWMGQLYEFLGLTVGVVVPGQNFEEKKAAYAADITYATNNELGFDYLRDNMAFSKEQQVQRGLNYAIVDEVDSILIDEARTPLIISGPSDDDVNLYAEVNKLVPKLEKGEKDEDGNETGHFTADEKGKQVHITEAGHEVLEREMSAMGILEEGASLYDPANIVLLHHANAALRAHHLFRINVDYIVRDGQIMIVDEFTGRVLAGRRWSDGLHQALEAKEGLDVQRENQTLASITFQNYFRIYNKLSGMTGTADTEAYEFQDIYGLEVVVIPTNVPVAREDCGDKVYLSAQEKFEAIVEDIREVQSTTQQPILVGTASIEVSELIAAELAKAGIKHEVLNAKNHAREAEIIEQAGRPMAVTIATNMAGRGTDIVLGGNLEAELRDVEGETQQEQVKKTWQARHQQVLDAGGLYVIGTERHESRRVDNQLRGRSGRQGDPGKTRFYLSLEDTLMRIFASPRMAGLMQRLGLERGEAIEHRWVTRAIENAQRKVEAHNYDIRKNLLEYDDVANDQRKVIYGQRYDMLEQESVQPIVQSIRGDVVEGMVNAFVPVGSLPEQWDLAGLEAELKENLGVELDVTSWVDAQDQLDTNSLINFVLEHLIQDYQEKENLVGEQGMRGFEKSVLLQLLDKHWKEHLSAMDYLRQGIHLRGYAQKNPKQEYRREAFIMFQQMLDGLKSETLKVLSRVQVRAPEEVQALEERRRAAAEAAAEAAKAQ
ncbi:MAG: preprotein translocase subunit SecA, partial [Gammaproteobacteria bacterium]|nr:preprotein translocase subunit SecA [Gammaproteobacteria bacterium]